MSLVQTDQLFLIGDITEDSISTLYKQLCYLESTDLDIRLNICSGGGDVECACAILDKLNELGNNRIITTVACGKTHSAAAIILASGKRRLAYTNSCIMFHHCSYSLPEDTHTKHKSYVDFTHLTYNRLLEQVCNNCKMGSRQTKIFMEKSKEDFWMTAQEAKQFNIIQEII